MKKIITTLALAGAFGYAANAQRTIDVSTFVVYDSDSIVDVNCTDSITFQFGYINNGPDEVLALDSFVIATPLNNYTETAEGGTINASGPYGVSETVGLGDTLALITGTIHPDQIQFLFSMTPEGNIGPVVYPPFENGIYAGMFYFGKFGNVSGGSWVPSTEITDPNDTNNVNYMIFRYDCSEDSSTSIANNNLGKSINVYPNPTSGNLNFTFDVKSNESVAIRIYDITGKNVLSKDLGNQNAGNKNITLDVSNLPNGNYSLEVSTDSQKGYSKFVITR